jgi:hypothetical protein
MATWYYPGGEPDTSFGDGTTFSGWAPSTYCYGAAITLPAGTVTQLGAYVDTASQGDMNLKLGIYDSGGALVVQASPISIPSGSTKTWRTADVADTAISAGTFYVVGVADNVYFRWGYDSSGNGVFVNQNYASSMGSSVTIDGPETGYRYGVRAEVEESGGGRTTKNTRGFTHGIEVGMNWRGNL